MVIMHKQGLIRKCSVRRIVGYNPAPEAKFFVDAPAAFSQNTNIMDVGVATNFVRLLTMGPTWIALAPLFAATACILLSIIRLAHIARHDDYGDSSSGNLKPALLLFYALVLTQGALFLLWLAVAWNRMAFAQTLSSRYLENKEAVFSRKEGKKGNKTD